MLSVGSEPYPSIPTAMGDCSARAALMAAGLSCFTLAAVGREMAERDLPGIVAVVAGTPPIV